MAFLGPAFWVVILLGVMILIHELGHFWAAIAVGVKVETFSIGFGPRLIGFKRGETDFRLSAIPFGGYVRMLGEQPGDETAVIDPRSFQAKARWQRAIVIFAGPAMNIILAVGLVTGLYMAKYPKELATVITGVVPDSPAAQAGLREGDHIVQFGDDQHPTWDYIVSQELVSAGRPLHMVVERAGKPVPLTVTPVLDPKEGVGQMGLIAEPNTQIGELKSGPAQAAGLKRGDLFLSVNGVKVFSAMTVRQAVIHSGGKPVHFQIMHDGKTRDLDVTPRATQDSAMPFQIGVVFQIPVQWTQLGFADAFSRSIQMNERNATTMFQVLAGVLERRVSPKSFSGPIGMAQMSSDAASQGPWMYLSLMAFVSLQLAIFNLLPIPILDGGTLLLLLIEMLMQREVSLRVKETVFKLGFVFLMMLVVFVIYNDITKILTRS